MPTFRQAVREFKMRVKRIVTLAFLPERHGCFNPYGISYIRLRGLGITTLVPGIEGTMCMSTTLRNFVCSTLISVAHKIPQRRADLIVQNALPLHPTRFPMRRRTELFHGARKFGSALTDTIVQNAPPSPHVTPAFFRISCPHCSALLDAAGRKLYGPAGWASLVCKRCG